MRGFVKALHADESLCYGERARPAGVHCHLGLGVLYVQTGRLEQVCAAQSAAIALYRTMEMTLRLPQAEAALAHVG